MASGTRAGGVQCHADLDAAAVEKNALIGVRNAEQLADLLDRYALEIPKSPRSLLPVWQAGHGIDDLMAYLGTQDLLLWPVLPGEGSVGPGRSFTAGVCGL